MNKYYSVKEVDGYAWYEDTQGSSFPLMQWRNALRSISKWFDGTTLNPYYDPNDASRGPEYLPNIFGGATGNTIADIIGIKFLTEYGDRYFGKEAVYYNYRTRQWVTNEADVMEDLLAWINQVVNQYVMENRDRIPRMIGSLYFKYNPIENYNMIENGDDHNKGGHTVTKNGKRSLIHGTTDASIGLIDVDAPLDTFSASIDQNTGKITITNFGASTSKDVSSTSQGVGQTNTRNGKLGTGTSISNGVATSSSGDGIENKTVHQTSTEDSDTFRNEYQDQAIGDVLNDSNASSVTKNEYIATAKIRSGSPEGSYTDTEEYDATNPMSEHFLYDTPDGEYTEHQLSRSGNIGVTTSQQMIESERALNELNIYNLVFEELSKRLFLAVLK